MRLKEFRSGRYTYDAWSYGNWETSHSGTQTIETFAAPYTLLLAIRRGDSGSGTVEILQAALVGRDGSRTSVLATLADRSDQIQMRHAAAISQPYAVFQFDKLLESHETTTLEIEFRVTREHSVETIKQQLTIPGYEKVMRSFTFWEALMSV